MKKRITILCELFLCILLFASCTGNEMRGNNINKSEMDAAMPLLPPTCLQSYEELNEYLVSAQKYSKDTKSFSKANSEEQQVIKTAVNIWKIGDIDQYYMPAWIPDRFELNHIAITERYIGYIYNLVGYESSEKSKYKDELANVITFEWTRVETGAELLKNTVSSRDLTQAAGYENLYYEDFGTTTEPDIYLRRNYYWLEDGYRFMMSIPLWVIEDIEKTVVGLELNKDIVFNDSKVVEINAIENSAKGNIDVDDLVSKSVLRIVLAD